MWRWNVLHKWLQGRLVFELPPRILVVGCFCGVASYLLVECSTRLSRWRKGDVIRGLWTLACERLSKACTWATVSSRLRNAQLLHCVCSKLLELRLRLLCVFDDFFFEHTASIHRSHTSTIINCLFSIRDSALYTRQIISDTTKRCRQQFFNDFTYLCTRAYTK